MHLSTCAVSLAETLLPSHQRASGVVSFLRNPFGKYLSLLSCEEPEPDPFVWGSAVTPEMLFLIQSEVPIVLTWTLPACLSVSGSYSVLQGRLGLGTRRVGKAGKAFCVSWSRPVRPCDLGVMLCHGRTKP